MQKITMHNDNEIRGIKIQLWTAADNEEYSLKVDGYEYGFILLNGEAAIITEDARYNLAHRRNPIEDKGDILLISRKQTLKIVSHREETRLVIIRVKAEKSYPDQFIAAADIRETERGKDNWKRSVRLGIWSDNSVGERLLIGETIVPPGNWSAMPAHRHDEYEKDSSGISQVPYQEIYLFQFSKPSGFGLCKIFNNNRSEIFEVKHNEAVFIGNGYHTLVNSPLSSLYHLTVMAGKYRQSTAQIHEDYYPLIEAQSNPYREQEKKL